MDQNNQLKFLLKHSIKSILGGGNGKGAAKSSGVRDNDFLLLL